MKRAHGLLLDDHLDHILAVDDGLTEERLLPGVMVGWVEVEQRVAEVPGVAGQGRDDRPTGKRPRHRLDVVLGVVADA